MSKDFVRPPPLELTGTVPPEDQFEKMPVHEQWTCGHTATAVCAECYRELGHKANELMREIERLQKERDEAWEARDEYIAANVKLKDEIEHLRFEYQRAVERLRAEIELVSK